MQKCTSSLSPILQSFITGMRETLSTEICLDMDKNSGPTNEEKD